MRKQQNVSIPEFLSNKRLELIMSKLSVKDKEALNDMVMNIIANYSSDYIDKFESADKAIEVIKHECSKKYLNSQIINFINSSVAFDFRNNVGPLNHNEQFYNEHPNIKNSIIEVYSYFDDFYTFVDNCKRNLNLFFNNHR